MYKVVLIALFCAIKGVHACVYNSVGGPCIVLDDFSANCFECSASTDLFINAMPNSLVTEKFVGPCGCVIRVSDPNKAATLCESLVTVLINSLGLSGPSTPLFRDGCLRDKQAIALNILNNETCNGCGGAPTPVPTSGAPTPVPTSVAPTPVPTPVAPTPVPTPVAPTPVSTPNVPMPAPSPPSSGGGTSCIAGHQVVTIEDQGSKRITELKSGDIVLTDKGFREYIGDIHDGRVSSTLIIHTDDGRSIELTADHLIKTEQGFIHASRLHVGSLLVGSEVVRIENSSSFVVSPLTRSGTIVVNGIVLSCYATVFSHTIANFVLIPVTANVAKDVGKYFSVLTTIYSALPKYVKHYIAANNTIVL